MRINEPCNLDVPSGATPMTIADAILRECDDETLTDVLHYIDCFMKLNHPHKNGKWIKIHPQEIYECSECHQNVATSDIECYRYCPNCGARMDKDEPPHGYAIDSDLSKYIHLTEGEGE